jgi:gliding motility-associated-like protein
MKKVIIYILLLIPLIGIGQNLIPNPSFEEYDSCVSSIDAFNMPSYIHGLKYWISPNFSSPDFLENCNINPDFGMPQNYGGFQQARTGNGMVDLGNIISNINYRENIQTELLQPLEANKKYCFSMYVSLMDSCWYATDNFGACITDTAIYSYSGGLTSFVPQIINPIGNILNDKVNWTNISGEYIAHGGEKYITLGVFADDNTIDTIRQPYGSGYWDSIDFKVLGYYIDDVSLYYCDDTIYAEAGNNAQICIGDSAQIGSPPNNDFYYSWQPSAGINNTAIANPKASPIIATIYYLTQTDFLNNISVDSVTVTVISCGDTTKNILTIPNACTPNNDGVNDIFKAHGQNIKTINAKIFNRWGQELFKWNDINSGWDGKHNGNDVSAGVYFYVISVEFGDGIWETKMGSVEVVR